ncbi:hypothetical protein PYH37_002088 [Sinorhizobium numidicum]|uniref:Uncharacterized protein n=1 Tax=Sinorhizobium numidicum TaxID=680248 RepID=A0ABY8CT29_9HYPH|nr:hypothetical protein [Sinorhizobium numidicum]WEX74636.1 hypothetical protein PYH37_002088 [Sinorhizobium numidicum]WEX80627.1 hypothetical protein PYH38_002090 [Sinorhizobium numidicum]
MEANASDRELIEVMRRYFATKAELAALKAQLEAARQAAGAEITTFYDPRHNRTHAGILLRSHDLKREMASLMERAETWARAEIAANQDRLVEASTAEEPSSPDRPTDTPFDAAAASSRLND